MEDTPLERMRKVLPELFDMNAKLRKPGGMCTPGAGCPPEAQGAGTDILDMLTRAADLPSEEPTDEERQEARADQASGDPVSR